MNVKNLTILAIITCFSFAACDSNIEQEDRTKQQTDSLSGIMEEHQDKIDELSSSLELNLEKLESKLKTIENEEGN